MVTEDDFTEARRLIEPHADALIDQRAALLAERRRPVRVVVPGSWTALIGATLIGLPVELDAATTVPRVE